MRKIIVAGGRDFTNRSQLHEVCRAYFGPEDQLVCGMAKGADAMALAWADGQRKRVLEFPADWDKHPKAAGPIRNRKMAQEGDTLIAFWDGKSRGTKNMIDEALKAGLEIHVFRYGEDS